MPWVCGSSSVGRVDCLVGAQFHGAPLHDGGVYDLREVNGNAPFYEYYQICRDVEPDESASEPQRKGELRTRHEGSHSPFGFIWQIASATGWSVDYILHGVNYQTLIMMLSDAPRYVRVGEHTDDGRSAEDEGNDIVQFFQSRLNE